MNYKTLTNKDAEWPNELNNILPLPDRVFLAGHLPAGPRIGVIGSRRPTAYGKQVVGQLVEPLAKCGAVIVSGLAIGIDGLAHSHTLNANGKTIAVLPSGINSIYPARHGNLAQKILQHEGALVSEYPDSTKAEKSHFIARNRIIAALSDVLLVIEAAEKSGTMHTVDFALQLGKDVAAVPGPINSLYSRGTNRLLKNGACLVDGPDSLFQLLGVEPVDAKQDIKLPKPECYIYESICKQPQSFNQLLSIINIDEKDLRIAISHLEIDNLVAPNADGMYALR